MISISVPLLKRFYVLKTFEVCITSHNFSKTKSLLRSEKLSLCVFIWIMYICELILKFTPGNENTIKRLS